MATIAPPEQDHLRGSNVPTANNRLPGVRDYQQVDREILGTLQPSLGWFAALGTAILCLLIGASAWTYQIHEGLGAAGYHPPVMWGVYIVTFVFWVGIGHAGTLISAILYLFRAGFRTTIYRASEAMTVFAVMTAGLFPILHLGRPWKFFWLIPYPNWRLLWPNPKSPLVWDVFAILTYLTVSATFFYVGLVPDIAVLRDQEKNKGVINDPPTRLLGRHYGFVTYQDDETLNSTHFAVFALVNTDDQSRFTSASLRYTISALTSVELAPTWYSGKVDSEFGEMPFSQAIYLVFRGRF